MRALVAAALLVLLGGRVRAQEPPNIVLAIADDLDPDHLGFCGNALARTPNLDQLARTGVTFSTLYAQPVCRPALATLLSGRWPHQSGIVHNLTSVQLDPAGVLPARLRARGYATFCGGKFWEGDHHAYGFSAPEQRDERFARNRDEGQTELFEFLERQAKAGPWFVWWAPSLPHVPHHAPVRFARAFEQLAIPVPEGSGPREEYVAAERALLAMEAWMDAEFGKLLKKLDELGERDETLIVFLADNGWATALLSKGTPREKGVRSPLVFALPGKAAPARRVEARVDLVDVSATLLDFAGAPARADSPGRSLRAWLAGGSGPSRELLCGAAYGRSGEGPPAQLAYALYARDERWKYVLYLRDLGTEALTPGGKLAPAWQARAGAQELFDLELDPLERSDLSALVEQAERLGSLRGAVLDWWRASGGGELPGPR